MIETLTTAVIVLAICLVGLALMFGVLLSDQNRHIARVEKDVFETEEARRSDYYKLCDIEKRIEIAILEIDRNSTDKKERRRMVNFWKLAYETVKEQRDQFKAERDTLIDDLTWYKAKVSRLERELSAALNGELASYDKLQEYTLELQIELKDSQKQNEKLNNVANEAMDIAESENHKVKAFDEVKKYTLNNHDRFEDRKDRAKNSKEYDYFSALQIANSAIINKCKQLEEDG